MTSGRSIRLTGQATSIGVLLLQFHPGSFGLERYLTRSDLQNQFHQPNPHSLGSINTRHQEELTWKSS
jgi:hypothetical protein